MKIAVFGLGVSGLSALKYLTQKTSHQVFAINQGAVESWPMLDKITPLLNRESMLSEEEAMKMVSTLDQIILSPGIARTHALIQAALKAQVSVICDIELAFKDFSGKIIAVTGSNGKTTTVTMISELLNQLNYSVFTGGNIGTGACERFFNPSEYDVAVLELSSFQLESIEKFYPQVAILLNVSETHMERYQSVEEYRSAKYNLFNNQSQTDLAILGEGLPRPTGSMNVETIGQLSQFDFSKCKLLGIHNQQNFYCAFKVLEYLQVPDRDQIFQKFIEVFRGVKHRLQFAGSKRGVDFYNDAKSTNYHATRVAVEAVMSTQRPICLLLGGKLRSDKVNMLPAISGLEIQNIIAYGEARELLQQNLQGEFQVTCVETLDQAIDTVVKSGFEGIVLYSPAFPSFDQYTSYEKRGEHFLKLVSQL